MKNIEGHTVYETVLYKNTGWDTVTVEIQDGDVFLSFLAPDGEACVRLLPRQAREIAKGLSSCAAELDAIKKEARE